MPPCQEDSRSFFEQLQNAKDLDLRDKRGKKHDLAVILVGVTLAVLSNRDGCLSSIHRHLVNHYEKLAAALGVENKRVVSRSQLPLILEKVAVEVFDRLLFENYRLKLNPLEKKWFAMDGKELRGSIEKGSRRGEAVVAAIAHESRQSFAQDYYCGKKQSEVKVVRKLLEEHRLGSEKISLDALHCKPETLLMIVQARGKYVVGLKENQKQLLKQVSREIREQAFIFKTLGIEKGHGRIETRSYEFYDIKSKDAANKLREKYKIHQDDESGNIDALLKQKDGEKLATNAAIKSLANQSRMEMETIFLIGQLQIRKSPEFFRLLTAVVNALETGQVDFNTNDLLMMSGYSTETNVPIEVQKKFFKIVVNKSRNVMQMPGGDVDTAFHSLSLIIPEISTKFPELLPEAIIIQSALKVKASSAYTEAQEREDRIKNNSDKLSAYISEAEQADNQAVKYDLYVSAAHLALKMGKFKYAVDIVEKTAELDKSKIVSEIFRTQWRDQFFGQVTEKALKANDPDSANYAIKKMTDLLAKSEGLKKTANCYFEQRETVPAIYSLDDAIKMTVKAENTPRRTSSFINLIPAVQKIDRSRVSDFSELTAKSINTIPSLNVEDKPQTKNYKNYVTSVMNINRVLLPALTSLIKENKSEAINLADSINKEGNKNNRRLCFNDRFGNSNDKAGKEQSKR